MPPGEVDEKSRELIEEFAKRNPQDPARERTVGVKCLSNMSGVKRQTDVSHSLAE